MGIDSFHWHIADLCEKTELKFVEASFQPYYKAKSKSSQDLSRPQQTCLIDIEQVVE
jgi:hypothetical protein